MDACQCEVLNTDWIPRESARVTRASLAALTAPVPHDGHSVGIGNWRGRMTGGAVMLAWDLGMLINYQVIPQKA
jgi:hypothetical protein